MANQEVKEFSTANAGQACCGIREVAPLNINGTVTISAVTGEEGNKSGSGSYLAFGQPMGLSTGSDNTANTVEPPASDRFKCQTGGRLWKMVRLTRD